MNISVVTLCSLGRTMRNSENYIVLVLLFLVSFLVTPPASGSASVFSGLDGSLLS